MDRLTSMAVFVKAAESGSFAAAAHALDLSGPMVGKHVRHLEQRLGVQLLNRTTRRQSLTAAGQAYFEHCREVLTQVAAAEAVAADQRLEPVGKLRVSMPVLFGRRCVAPVLLAFAERHPGLELELSLNDRLVDLVDDPFDLTIRTGALPDRAGVIARRVARQQMVVCAAPSYLRAHGRPASIADLMDHQAVLYRRTGAPIPWRFPVDGGAPREVTPKSRLRLDDLEAIADAAAAGFGLAWLPCWLIGERIASGALTPLLPDQPRFPYDVHAMWLQTPHLPLKVRLAVDALADALPKMMA